MRYELSLVLTLTALVLLPALALGAPSEGSLPWTHMAGDAQRSATGPLAPEPLDLLNQIRLTNESMSGWDLYAEGFYETSRGVAVLGADDAGDCVLFFVPNLEEESSVERVEVDGCQAGSLGFYDPAREWLAVCSATSNLGDPTLLMLSMEDLEPVWTVSMSDVIGTGGQGGDPAGHRCEGITHRATDDTLLVGLVSSAVSAGNGGIVAIEAPSGDVQWYTRYPAYPFLEGDRGAADAVGASGGFIPVIHSHTEAGIMVAGATASSSDQATGLESAALWMDHDGQVQGAVRAGQLHGEEAQVDGTYPAWGATWPTGEGAASMVHMGGKLVVVDARREEPLQVVPHRAPDGGAVGSTLFSGPAWHEDTVLVPLDKTVTRYDADALGEPLWNWRSPVEETISGLLIAPPGDAIALSFTCEDGCQRYWVHRLDLDTGEEMQRLALESPQPAVETAERAEAALLPLDDGRLLVAADPGVVWLLGPAPDKRLPSVNLSSAYPLPNEPVELTPAPPDGATPTRYDVFWGDGASTAVQPGETVTHRFDEPHIHTVRVTAVFEDGTTATKETVVRVGETAPPPPPDLNVFQQAFKKENQDMTFGLLGLGVALAGGAIGLGRRYRKRSRLQEELEAVERAYEETRGRPLHCEAQLDQRKTHARGLVLDGELDEQQFGVIEQRIEELLKRVRMSAMEDEFDFLPHGLVKRAREMLTDGTVSTLERDAFLQAVEEDDVLTDEQKATVRDRIEAWSARDAGGGGPPRGEGIDDA